MHPVKVIVDKFSILGAPNSRDELVTAARLACPELTSKLQDHEVITLFNIAIPKGERWRDKFTEQLGKNLQGKLKEKLKGVDISFVDSDHMRSQLNELSRRGGATSFVIVTHDRHVHAIDGLNPDSKAAVLVNNRLESSVDGGLPKPLVIKSQELKKRIHSAQLSAEINQHADKLWERYDSSVNSLIREGLMVQSGTGSVRFTTEEALVGWINNAVKLLQAA